MQKSAAPRRLCPAPLSTPFVRRNRRYVCRLCRLRPIGCSLVPPNKVRPSFVPSQRVRRTYLAVGHGQQQKAAELKGVREPVEQSERNGVPLLARGDGQDPEHSTKDLTRSRRCANNGSSSNREIKQLMERERGKPRTVPVDTHCAGRFWVRGYVPRR